MPMSANTLKIVFALLVMLVTFLGGIIPFKRRIKTEGHLESSIGETLATGVFLGAALLHMLPQANESFDHLGYSYPFAFIITGSVFLFFLWFEHLGKELYHHQNKHHPAFAILAWLMLSFHSVMLGAALGINQRESMMIVLFLAIITHKWAESFAIAVELNKSTMKQRDSFILFLLFVLMTPLGIYLGWLSGSNVATATVFEPVLISASAGTFLYLGTLHGLDTCVLVEKCCNLKDFSYVIIGFLLMAVVAIYV